MAKFYLDNKITVEDYTTEMFEWCCKNLVFDNPDYISRERMGKWTGGTEKYLVMYERYHNTLILPFGCLRKFYTAFKNDFEVVENRILPLERQSYSGNISLYDYQERAVEAAIRGKNGIIVAPCGSGKTQIGIEIISRLKGRTLWIAHTHDLVQQSYERAKANLDLPTSEYGMITAGKVSIGKITFATVQTLSKIDLDQYKNAFDVIICDEVHHVVGCPTKMQMFYKVLSKLSARYRYGLTATPYRADGLDGCMFAVLGDIIHEVKKEEVDDNTCPVKVNLLKTRYEPNLDIVLAGDGTIVYSSLIKDVTENNDRNCYIGEIIRELDGATLVLSDRVSHLKELQKWLRYGISEIIDGSMQSKAAKTLRKEVLRKLNDGELDVVFATYKLAKEGLDVPNLRYVVFASPIKDKTTVTQAAGRVARKADGKEFGTIIDFSDNFGLLREYERKRKSIYKKLKYEISD